MTLDAATRVLFLHAHPDDETLATGALIAGLADRGTEVAVVTATRGERGEVTDPGFSGDLVALREGELAAALAVLGVRHHAFLGTPPARSGGVRRYTDSGMVWVTPQVAGPGAGAGPDSLTAASVDEAAADLAAYIEWFRPDVLVSYDEFGGYGHPDHVACHHIAVAAAEFTGVRFAEVVSGATQPTLDQYRGRVAEALGCYASQLRVDGDEVEHVGGQRHPLPTVAALRERSSRD